MTEPFYDEWASRRHTSDPPQRELPGFIKWMVIVGTALIALMLLSWIITDIAARGGDAAHDLLCWGGTAGAFLLSAALFVSVYWSSLDW